MFHQFYNNLRINLYLNESKIEIFLLIRRKVIQLQLDEN